MSIKKQPELDLGLPPLPEPVPPAPPRAAVSSPRPGPPPPALAPRPEPPLPFNYTDAMEAVVGDIVVTLEEFRHVDLDRVVLAVMQARQASRYGKYASCFAMRFEDGASEVEERGARWRMPTLTYRGREVLYVLYFMLPRFHAEQDYHGKLATIIHELYHISPLFNGDIRRFPGKNFAHGTSREVYHAAMCRLADRYLALSPRARAHDFLNVPFATLVRHPGGLVGRRIRKPQPYRV